MRTWLILAAAALSAAAPARQSASDEPYWTPDAALISRLEATLKIYGGPGQTRYALTDYDRYYAGVTVNGRRVVRGVLLIPPNPEDQPKTGIHITDSAHLPDLASYDRHYSGITIDGSAMIRGWIIKLSAAAAKNSGMHLSSEPDGAFMMDGGCNNIQAVYEVSTAKFTELHCDGQGGYGVLAADK